MHSLIVDVRITADEYLKHYQFPGAVVYTRSRDFRSVKFPASILQRYVTRQGVSGSFEISFDQTGKFTSIRQL